MTEHITCKPIVTEQSLADAKFHGNLYIKKQDGEYHLFQRSALSNTSIAVVDKEIVPLYYDGTVTGHTLYTDGAGYMKEVQCYSKVAPNLFAKDAVGTSRYVRPTDVDGTLVTVDDFFRTVDGDIRQERMELKDMVFTKTLQPMGECYYTMLPEGWFCNENNARLCNEITVDGEERCSIRESLAPDVDVIVKVRKLFDEIKVALGTEHVLLHACDYGDIHIARIPSGHVITANCDDDGVKIPKDILPTVCSFISSENTESDYWFQVEKAKG